MQFKYGYRGGFLRQFALVIAMCLLVNVWPASLGFVIGAGVYIAFAIGMRTEDDW